MSQLPPPTAMEEIEGPVDHARLDTEIRKARTPVVMRGLVSHWPAVAAAKESDEAITSYLLDCHPTRPVNAMFAPPEDGSFHMFDPANVAPLVGYLASPEAGRISGEVMVVWGNEVSILERPKALDAIANPKGAAKWLWRNIWRLCKPSRRGTGLRRQRRYETICPSPSRRGCGSTPGRSMPSEPSLAPPNMPCSVLSQ